MKIELLLDDGAHLLEQGDSLMITLGTPKP